ncbi:TPA: minor capsid protein [Streptococcus suis]
MFERFDAFATKYPEYAYLLPIRESIYRLDRLEGLQYNIRLAQLEVGASEQTALKKHLLDTYTGTYGRFAKELGLGMVDKQTAQLLINADWTSAGNYSSSIWSNRDKLAKYLANDVRNAFIRGDNYAKIAKAMEERFSKVSKADIRRLVYTEGTYVANMAMMAPFEESGLYDEYEYVAVIDGSTSDVCRGLDGQKYKIADKMPGVNFPPMHPRCRSTFLIVMPEDVGYKQIKINTESLSPNNQNSAKILENAVKSGKIKLDTKREPDVLIPQSLSAKARPIFVKREYPVRGFEEQDEYLKIIPGTKITGVHIIAGKGVKRKIDIVDYLIEEYPTTKKSEWKKMIGFAELSNGRMAEVHWFEAPNAGKVKFKVKRYVR